MRRLAFWLALSVVSTTPAVLLMLLLPAQDALEAFVRVWGFIGWGWLVGTWAAGRWK